MSCPACCIPGIDPLVEGASSADGLAVSVDDGGRIGASAALGLAG
jgi:hypothetical protein